MPVDPHVLASIERLVEQDPADVPLRLHLADLLLADEQAVAAQGHVSLVLSAHPDHIGALGLAARVADVLGDATRATGYRRLIDGLAPESPPPAPTPQAAPSPPASAEQGRPERVGLRLVEGNKVDPLPEVEAPGPAITLKDVAGMET